MPSKMPSRILITAGATYEQIDPVRFIGNRSSGNVGCQIALAAAVNCYEVTLLHSSYGIAPTVHPRLHSIPFSTTRDLFAKLQETWPSHDLLIMAAAVSDFTPRGGQQLEKINRGNGMTLELASTEDLVATLAASKRTDQRILAFALGKSETIEEIALEKMKQKGVDAIIANSLEAMDAKNISATLLCKSGWSSVTEDALSKPAFARWLIDQLPTIIETT